MISVLLITALCATTWAAATGDVASCFTSASIAARWDGSSFDSSNGWSDLSGNGVTATVTTGTATGYTATDASDELYLNGEPVVYGTPSTRVDFGELSVTKEHSIFNLCKYREGSGNKRRILNSDSTNSLFGHWNGKSGVSYQSGWLTNENLDSFGTDWVLSSQTNYVYRGNTQDLTLASWSGSANIVGTLAINQGGESSDWACAEIIVVNDVSVTEEEMICVEEYFSCKYQLGLYSDDNCDPQCAALDIDDFLETCSDLWDASSSGVEANTASIAALESALAQVEDSIAVLSNGPSASNAVFGDHDGFKNLFGFDASTGLMLSLIANFILISIGCCIWRDLKRNHKYTKVESYMVSGSDTEAPLNRK